MLVGAQDVVGHAPERITNLLTPASDSGAAATLGVVGSGYPQKFTLKNSASY